MDRREFLKRAALIATGAIAADQLELLERLGHVRKFFPSAAIPYTHHTYSLGYLISQEIIDDDLYGWQARDIEKVTQAYDGGRVFELGPIVSGPKRLILPP